MNEKNFERYRVLKKRISKMLKDINVSKIQKFQMP